MRPPLVTNEKATPGGNAADGRIVAPEDAKRKPFPAPSGVRIDYYFMLDFGLIRGIHFLP